MDTVKWLLVGAGDIAHKRVAPALSMATNSKIAGIVSSRQQHAHMFADEYNVKEVFTDLSDALKNTSAATA